MRSTYRILMLSTLLLGAPLAIAQAQTGTMAPSTSTSGQVGAYSTVEELLTAANQAIGSGQTGVANQQLAWAKTKLINRLVPSTNGPQTYGSITSPVWRMINDARFALSMNDTMMAQHLVTEALATKAPELAY
jgi:hypothetical protein